MFKVISKTNLIQNVRIIEPNGQESVACIYPKGFVYTRRITPSLQYLLDNKQVRIEETSENLNKQEINNSDSSVSKDKGSFTENMNITEFNSQEEKENFENSQSEDTPEEVDKPKRSRRKKTDGGDLDDNK